MCRHSEGQREGRPPKGKPKWDKHNCAYVDARNTLIPLAEQLACQRLREEHPEDFKGIHSMKWSQLFLSFMDELWRKQGQRILSAMSYMASENYEN